MSITLMAYPTAFLISPQKAKNEKIKIFGLGKSKNIAEKKLCNIKVFTNLSMSELQRAMTYVRNFSQIKSGTYSFENGLKAQWESETYTSTVNLYGCENAEKLQKYGEQYFQELDRITGRNVRELHSKEIFYYTYETDYSNIDDIVNALNNNSEASDIYITKDGNGVSAKVSGDNIKYYQKNEKFYLEVEKLITIVNIGTREEMQGGGNIQQSLQSTKIETNIKPEELKDLLQFSGYRYLRGSSETPLKSPHTALNWSLENGRYVAEFCGTDREEINNEIEKLFKSLNKTSGRDVRLVNNQSRVIYTYSTNYTDKGVLINTLLEHGATNLSDNGDVVSCKLFNMDMVYRQNNGEAFTLSITRVVDLKDCENLMNDLNEEYGLNIQEMTYNKIKERLAEENMRLEDETVLEDNSIVLTIDVG